MLTITGQTFIGLTNRRGSEPVAGILTAHAFHLLSVLMLHELTLTVYPTLSPCKRSKIAFLAASLHVVSSAGMFLSAPYAESCFSLLNFLGIYLYAKTFGTRGQSHTVWRDASILLSGLIFGVATTFRGNGLFSGLVLVYDAMDCVVGIFYSTELKKNVQRLFVVCFAGTLMASIAVLPQYLAYKEYCSTKSTNTPLRLWCANWIPSIYAWVQKEYW